MLGKKIPRELSANFLLGFGQSVNLSAHECARCSCIHAAAHSGQVQKGFSGASEGARYSCTLQLHSSKAGGTSCSC